MNIFPFSILEEQIKLPSSSQVGLCLVDVAQHVFQHSTPPEKGIYGVVSYRGVEPVSEHDVYVGGVSH